MNRSPRWVLGAAFLIVSLNNHAASVYTDSTLFNADISGYSASTLNFDGSTVGDLIADGGTLGGITFDYATLDSYGVAMRIAGGSPTTSSPNYLGTDDGDLFQAGDGFSLSFAASNAIGLFFISADEMFDDDIQLTVNSTVASLTVADALDLDGVNFAYFLGIVDDSNPFTSVEISTFSCGGCFLYNVDDITTAAINSPPIGSVPAPPVFWLLLIGFIPLRHKFKHATSASTARLLNINLNP